MLERINSALFITKKDCHQAVFCNYINAIAVTVVLACAGYHQVDADS